MPTTILTVLLLAGLAVGAWGQMQGPLRVHPSNPRYFTDGSGRAIYLTGAHTWANGPDTSPDDPPKRFDYPAYLRWLKGYGHNFFKLWVSERSKWDPEYPRPIYFDPVWYERPGPGLALDGKPKFDLARFNEAYFQRLSERVAMAQAQGIYVAVMLFDDWSVRKDRAAYTRMDPWRGHPYHASNNINGVNGDVNADGRGEETHKLPANGGDARVFAYQVAYVKRVIDAVNPYDNVLYEICNEAAFADNLPWQNALADTIRAYQARKPKQHLIGITGDWYADLDGLWSSRGDYIALADERVGDATGYANDPPDDGGVKVVVNDSDHMWGAQPATPDWLWKSFMRGIHTLDMDQYDGTSGIGGTVEFDSTSEPIRSLRLSMGAALRLANRMDLAAAEPALRMASTPFALKGPGEVALYLPEGGPVEVDLSSILDTLDILWYHIETNAYRSGGRVAGGASRRLTSPFSGAAVAHLTGGRPRPADIASAPRRARVQLDDAVIDQRTAQMTVRYAVRPAAGIDAWDPVAAPITVRFVDPFGVERARTEGVAGWPGRHLLKYDLRAFAPGVYLLHVLTVADDGRTRLDLVRKVAWMGARPATNE